MPRAKKNFKYPIHKHLTLTFNTWIPLLELVLSLSKCASVDVKAAWEGTGVRNAYFSGGAAAVQGLSSTSELQCCKFTTLPSMTLHSHHTHAHAISQYTALLLYLEQVELCNVRYCLSMTFKKTSFDANQWSILSYFISQANSLNIYRIFVMVYINFF